MTIGRIMLLPFKKAMNPSKSSFPEFELDAEGLNESNPEYLTSLWTDLVRYRRRRAYIENFNGSMRAS